jgi:hypothetical protein
MLNNTAVTIRDPFVVPVATEQRYYLFGTLRCEQSILFVPLGFCPYLLLASGVNIGIVVRALNSRASQLHASKLLGYDHISLTRSNW